MNRSLGAALLLSAVLFVPFISFQGASATASPSMTVQDVAVQANVSNCHLAVDAQGIVHISYYDEDAGSLMHATNAGGRWTTEVIAGKGLAGSANSIAVDSQGKVHMSYVGAERDGYGDLMYATDEGGSWSSIVVDDGYVTGYTSIAVDSLDHIHISYHTGHDYDNDSLKYATNAGGSWSVERVDTGMSGYYNAIAVDPQGNVHIISYAGVGGMPLKYSTNAGGSWSTQNMEDSVWIGSFCSIAADPMGRLHAAISTSDKISQVDLKSAVYSGSSWSSEAIGFGGYVWDRSIALDGKGAAHICYRDSAANELMYATDAGGTWSNMTIAALGSASAFASIAVDAEGAAHLCYIVSDDSGQHLRYAKIGGTSSEAPAAEPVKGTEKVAPEPASEKPSSSGQSMVDPPAAAIVGGLGIGAVMSVVIVLFVKSRGRA